MKKTETPAEKEQRELTEGIASNISKLAKNVAALLNGPLNRNALVTLLVTSSRTSRKQVEKVLKALQELEKDWLE